MGRIIGIDFGAKRTGLSVTDPMKIFAQPLTAIDTKELMSYLEVYVKENEVEQFVIGDPSLYQQKKNAITDKIDAFIRKANVKFPDIPIVKFDESFTSMESMQTLIQMGISKKKRRDKKLIDKVSAVLILQRYLKENES